MELQENILQRYHAEIVDLIKKSTGETEHRNSVFCLPSFCVAKRGVAGANHVIPFDHNIRSATGKSSEKEIKVRFLQSRVVLNGSN